MKKVTQKTAAWRNKSKGDLHKEIRQLQDDVTKKSIAVSLQQHKDTSILRKLKKDIARINTILRQESS